MTKEEAVAHIVETMKSEKIDPSQKERIIGEVFENAARSVRDDFNRANARLIPWKTEAQSLGLIASIRNEHGVEALAAWCKKLLPKSEAEDDAHHDGYEQGITDAQTMVDEIRAEANTPAVADVLNVIVKLLEAMKP